MANTDASIDVDMLEHELVEDADDALGRSASDLEVSITSASGANPTMEPDLTVMQFDGPLIASHVPSVPFSSLGEVLHEKAVTRNGVAVIVPPPQNRWEYKVFQEDDDVAEILEQYDDAGSLEYLVLFSDGIAELVSLDAYTTSASSTFTVNSFTLLLHHYTHPIPIATVLPSNTTAYVPVSYPFYL